MQALKLKGKIDESGHLIIAEPIHLTPGEVEIIILQSTTQEITNPLTPKAEEISSKISLGSLGKQIEEMSRDPQIQQEIKAIGQEFAITEMDELRDK
ncbi:MULTISPECIES: hypothetical protein [Spirulina sp. CCY15215]|uniref:hypothetical protein n=1 Tax=Spirulina sp. CCY15215 TaxID=2767591 RepID=UPI00195132B5|nr:hypothetical protein [Spirulina major]